jgi:hypothetical protein
MPRLRRTMIAVLGATLLTATVWASAPFNRS